MRLKFPKNLRILRLGQNLLVLIKKSVYFILFSERLTLYQVVFFHFFLFRGGGR